MALKHPKLSCRVSIGFHAPIRQLCTKSARQLHAASYSKRLFGMGLFPYAVQSIRRGKSGRAAPAVAGTSPAVAAASDEAGVDGKQQHPQHVSSNRANASRAGNVNGMQPNCRVAAQNSSLNAHTVQQSVSSLSTQVTVLQQLLKFPAGQPAQWLSMEALSAFKQKQHESLYVHGPFLMFFTFLGLMGITATSADWALDVACFGTIWSALWFMSCRLRPSSQTVALVNLLPLLHLFGSQGAYHWEMGNLSWDILVHVTNGFLGTLLFAAVLADVKQWQTRGAPASSAATAVGGEPSEDAQNIAATSAALLLPDGQDTSAAPPQSGGVRSMAMNLAAAAVLLVASTSMIEVVEAVGGNLAGHTGEGIFLRGAGDFCLESAPCSEEVDSMKDMFDNLAGMTLGLIALATSGSSSGGGGSSSSGSKSAKA